MSQVRAQSHYKVLERIATGGMAEVFHALSMGLGGFEKPVAIKRVLPHLAQNDKFIRMFLDEARLSARLNHRNIVQVFDVGQVEGAYFIVMEYVDGPNLKTLLDHFRKRGETLPVPLAVHVAIEVCNGLYFAHRVKDSSGRRLEVVHRDVSPPNVLLTRAGGVKLTDFGLARAVSQLEKTDPGVLKGKLSYLAPETAHGEEADALADVFAIGAVLWEMLAGRKLFQGETDHETVMQVRRCEVPSLVGLNAEVPAALDALVKRSLAREKPERFQSAGAMARALTEFLFAHNLPVTSEDLAIVVHEVLDVKYTRPTLPNPVRQGRAHLELEEQLKKLEPVQGMDDTPAPLVADDRSSTMPLPMMEDSAPSSLAELARQANGGDATAPPADRSATSTEPEGAAAPSAEASAVPTTASASGGAREARKDAAGGSASGSERRARAAGVPVATAVDSTAGTEVPASASKRRGLPTTLIAVGLVGAIGVGAVLAYMNNSSRAAATTATARTSEAREARPTGGTSGAATGPTGAGAPTSGAANEAPPGPAGTNNAPGGSTANAPGGSTASAPGGSTGGAPGAGAVGAPGGNTNGTASTAQGGTTTATTATTPTTTTATAAAPGGSAGSNTPAPSAPPAAVVPSNEPLPAVPGYRARTEMIRALQERVHACEQQDAERHSRHARAVATYAGATGRAESAHVNGSYFAGRPIAACIEQAIRDVPAPRFSQERWSTDYEFMLR